MTFKGILRIYVIRNMGHSHIPIARWLPYCDLHILASKVVEVLNNSYVVPIERITQASFLIFQVDWIDQRYVTRDKTRHVCVHHFL